MTSVLEATPETAKPAAPTSIPAEATKPAESVPSQTPDDFSARLAKADNPLKMQALLDEMRNKPAAPKPAAPKEEPAAETPKPDATETAKPEAGAEETPPADTPAPTPEAETPAGDADAPEEGDEDAEVVPLTGKRAHLRLPPEDDQSGRLAIALMKRNKDLTLEEALGRAKKQLGIKEPEPVAQPKADEVKTPPKDGLPETAEATDAEIDRLESELEKATTDLRFDDASKLNRQLRKLDRHRGDLVRKGERQEVEQQSAQAKKYDADFSASEKRASELYDFASDAASDAGKRMAEIDAALKSSGDPLYFSPNKPLVIAQMVGRELRIAPKVPGAKKVVTAKPATTTPPITAKPKSIVTDGGATTTPPKTGSTSKFDETVQKAVTIADLNKLRASLGLPH